MAQLSTLGIVRMAKTLKVQLTAPSPNLVHWFRNFGEDVYRALRDECEVSIRLMPKSSEPTAVGAVSSAVAVHVASRRWLSFLR